ncbi:MAG TPA: TrkA family potassium uptake protein [Candidatus Limnocylindrales bacterium]|nr:TrkA family potassium uptake protein [Candidatus Limnocylindrales bacterium]
MKAVIVGCGRVGSVLADAFDRAGQDVIIIDTSTSAFDRLPSSFGGSAVRGDGTDEDTLRRAGAESADLFMAMTEGDNRNVMAAQLAVEALDARRVIAKINDPLRAAAYAALGINTICRTNLMAAAVNAFLGLDLVFGPGMAEATGVHPGGEHHVEDAEPGTTGDPAASSAAPGGGSTVASSGVTDGSSTPTAPILPASPVAAREG